MISGVKDRDVRKHVGLQRLQQQQQALKAAEDEGPIGANKSDRRRRKTSQTVCH